jgi:Periplasmic copper-binding protein (NosD)
MSSHGPTRIVKLSPVLVVLALALPSSAFGQATRTWVSGVGDDANPCSRTAPCKTFAGAISKTAAGGIIMAMDDGGFGTLTITKPITVDGGHHQAGVLSSGGINGFNININPATQPANFVNNGKVVLKNLKIEGNSSIPSAGGFTPGLNGVRITNARIVKIYNSDIGFFSRNGIAVEPDASQSTKLVAKNNYIHDNGGNGVALAPKSAATAKATLRNNDIDSNGCGVAAMSFGFDSGFNFLADCAAASSASGVVGTAIVSAFHNSFTDGDNTGVFSRGANAANRIGSNEITGNTQFGLRSMDGGSIQSFGNNMITDNGSNGAPTGGLTPSKARSH